MSPLATFLKERREQLGLSQAGLASEAGVSAAQVSRLESGERSDPSFDTIVRLADALHASLDEVAAAVRDSGVTPEQWRKSGFDQVDEIVPGRVYEVWADWRTFRISITRAIQRGSTIEWNSTIDELVTIPHPQPEYDGETLNVWTSPVGIPDRHLGDTPTNALLDAMHWLSDWGGFDAVGRARRDAEAAKEMEPVLRAIVEAIDSELSDLTVERWRNRDRAKWSTIGYDVFVTRSAQQLIMTTYVRDQMKHARPVVRLPLTVASAAECAARIRELAAPPNRIRREGFNMSKFPEIKMTATFDTLGKWQAPILEAVIHGLEGSTVDYIPLPMGKVGLFVVWSGFGRDEDARKKRVTDILEKLGPNVPRLISTIAAFTPEESADLQRHGPFNNVVAALQQRLGGDIGFTIIPGLDFTVSVRDRANTLDADMVFSNAFLDRLPSDVNAVAGKLYEAGVFDFLNTESGHQSVTVERNGIRKN